MKINEDNFITRLKLGDEKALEYVCARYGWLLKTIVSKRLFYLQSMEEDCINDILFAVWVNINSYDSKKNTFKNWLAAVARYKCIDYMRRYLREAQHQRLEELATELLGEENPMERLMEEELSQEMEQMLLCLNQEDRELFRKLYVEEQDVEQVSRDLGINRAVVYNRLSRSKKKIRRLFSKPVKGEQHE